MHALLALGQAHLSFGESLSSARTEEAKHRAYAIRGVNNLIAKDKWTATENDAILVTLYALLFACSYTGDSIFEFFRLGQAVRNVTKGLNERPGNSVLVPNAGQAQDFVLGMQEKLKPYRIEQTPVSDALESLEALSSQPMNQVETQMYQLLLKTLMLLQAWDTKGE